MNVVPGWDSLLREIEVKIRSKVETDRGVLARHVLWSGENLGANSTSGSYWLCVCLVP